MQEGGGVPEFYLLSVGCILLSIRPRDLGGARKVASDLPVHGFDKHGILSSPLQMFFIIIHNEFVPTYVSIRTKLKVSNRTDNLKHVVSFFKVSYYKQPNNSFPEIYFKTQLYLSNV